jgi:hypothetical protein
VDEVKKLCLSMRRNAKDERVLFHYNGHGVPRPTNNGEIWVFNKVRFYKGKINWIRIILNTFPFLFMNFKLGWQVRQSTYLIVRLLV